MTRKCVCVCVAWWGSVGGCGGRASEPWFCMQLLSKALRRMQCSKRRSGDGLRGHVEVICVLGFVSVKCAAMLHATAGQAYQRDSHVKTAQSIECACAVGSVTASRGSSSALSTLSVLGGRASLLPCIKPAAVRCLRVLLQCTAPACTATTLACTTRSDGQCLISRCWLAL